MYQISSKSDDFSLRYGDLTIFKIADVRHLKFYGVHQCFFEKPTQDVGRRTAYWSSIETTNKLLSFEKVAFSCARFGDRQTISGQHHRIKPPSLSRAAS